MLTPLSRSARLVLLALVAASSAAVAPREAHAWGDIGHGAVGEIAQRNLSERGKAFVAWVLGPEPLAVSAVFPDQVRSDARFKAFSSYHFVEIPPGMTYATIPADQRVAVNGHAIINEGPALLANPRYGRDARMVLLRYLAHVVGDVHQPAHVGNGVDMGANLCTVHWKDVDTGDVVPSNLHTVWDERLIDWVRVDFTKANPPPPGTKRFFGYQELVSWVLKGDVPGADDVNAPLLAWYEGAQAVHKDMYPDATPVTDPALRPYCKRIDPVTKRIVDGAYDASKIPTLDEAYARARLPIVRRQIHLGGLRLARLINEIAEKIPAKALGAPGRDVEILNQVLKVKNPPAAP